MHDIRVLVIVVYILRLLRLSLHLGLLLLLLLSLSLSLLLLLFLLLLNHSKNVFDGPSNVPERVLLVRPHEALVMNLVVLARDNALDARKVKLGRHRLALSLVGIWRFKRPGQRCSCRRFALLDALAVAPKLWRSDDTKFGVIQTAR